MKKSLIAMAILAAAGVASAQSSVTLFGVVDATVAHGSGSVANKTQLTNSGYNSSRLGFRGVEDLGGGLKASFHLEAGVNNDNGSGANTSTNNQSTGSTGGGGLTFNRISTVSLSGGFGDVRLGRYYTPQFWNLTVYDPFGTNGVGTTQTLNSSLGGPVAVRASNSIGYTTPSFGGFKVWAAYYMGENLSNAGATRNDGRGLAVRLSYDNGPISVALATSKTDYATGNIATT
ncbi:MAG: porin, partial [Polaromonas sp.]|nr:porin [Polaromonas sp.]